MPLLHDLLVELKQGTIDASNEELVFPARTGRERTRHAVRYALERAVAKANVKLEAVGELPIEHATNHSLRRTYCALLFASGATLPEVIASMGHVSPTLSLAVYSKAIIRKQDTTNRADDLLREAFRAVNSTTPASTPVDEALAQLLTDTP